MSAIKIIKLLESVLHHIYLTNVHKYCDTVLTRKEIQLTTLRKNNQTPKTDPIKRQSWQYAIDGNLVFLK